jgi:hypothetical protein
LQVFWTLVAILVTLTLVSSQIDPSCDYYQELEVGSEYFIYNKEYPQNYAPWSSCRWSARSPVGTVISISCCDVVIPYVSGLSLICTKVPSKPTIHFLVR